jgi:hypothetical protein
MLSYSCRRDAETLQASTSCRSPLGSIRGLKIPSSIIGPHVCWDKVLFRVIDTENRTLLFAGCLERMKGLEPSTFCMANRSRRVRITQKPLT